MNDALLPEEQLKLLKGQSIGEVQKGLFLELRENLLEKYQYLQL